MPKAFIVLPPVEVEAGQHHCPDDGCLSWQFTFEEMWCRAYKQKLVPMVDPALPERRYLRCPACHDRERPAGEG